MSECGVDFMPADTAALGYWCTREKGHEGPCAAVVRTPSHPPLYATIGVTHYRGLCDGSDPEQCVLQEHGHGWEHLAMAMKNANLTEGGPLKVESLEATMKCVTYNAPDSHYQLERYSRWCARMAKVARFFRLRDLSDLFLRAEGHFLADAQYVRDYWNKYRRQREKVL